MLDAGRIPSADNQMSGYFWMFVLQAAEQNGDAATFEKALNGFKKQNAGNPAAKQMLEEMEKKLATLKAAG